MSNSIALAILLMACAVSGMWYLGYHFVDTLKRFVRSAEGLDNGPMFPRD